MKNAQVKFKLKITGRDIIPDPTNTNEKMKDPKYVEMFYGDRNINPNTVYLESIFLWNKTQDTIIHLLQNVNPYKPLEDLLKDNATTKYSDKKNTEKENIYNFSGKWNGIFYTAQKIIDYKSGKKEVIKNPDIHDILFSKEEKNDIEIVSLMIDFNDYVKNIYHNGCGVDHVDISAEITINGETIKLEKEKVHMSKVERKSIPGHFYGF